MLGTYEGIELPRYGKGDAAAEAWVNGVTHSPRTRKLDDISLSAHHGHIIVLQAPGNVAISVS